METYRHRMASGDGGYVEAVIELGDNTYHDKFDGYELRDPGSDIEIKGSDAIVDLMAYITLTDIEGYPDGLDVGVNLVLLAEDYVYDEPSELLATSCRPVYMRYNGKNLPSEEAYALTWDTLLPYLNELFRIGAPFEDGTLTFYRLED